MSMTIWLRAELKENEYRSPLTPNDAAVLLSDGYRVVVERSNQRIFQDKEYSDVGCMLANQNSWHSANKDTVILGIKELPDDTRPLKHQHIYFGHAYKQQAGWEHIIGRFKRHGGTLLDLEYLTNENGRRLAAFGYWAGYAGTAIALKIWLGRQIEGQKFILQPQTPYSSKEHLIDELTSGFKKLEASNAPKTIVIGALGRCGQGASVLLEEFDIPVVKWDIAETQQGAPFKQLLNFDILINTVLLGSPIPPFLTRELIKSKTRTLSVISDISCDPESSGNPLPIYNQATTFTEPTIRLVENGNPLDITAIDHLPSLLPRESSTEFSNQLLPALQRINKWSGEWQRCAKAYDTHSEKINISQV